MYDQTHLVREYLEQRLTTLNLWSSLLFWQTYFQDEIKDHVQHKNKDCSVDDSVTKESLSNSKGVLNQAISEVNGTNRFNSPATQVIHTTADSSFKILASIINQMIRLKVQKDSVQEILRVLSQDYQIAQENEQVLQTLIANLSNANFD